MTKTALEKRKKSPLKERLQYAGALGLIGVMLWVANFPVFLLVFLGLLTFFVWKVFSSEGRNETRRVFEFYLSANEILRVDDRRWYGFEVQETITKGESIVASMSAVPPLVHFALGSLYAKLGDNSAALKYLSQAVGENATSETAIVYPPRELREYVQMLRKIERAPAEAPLTSSAIRALERARKNRGKALLEQCRAEVERRAIHISEPEHILGSVDDAEGGSGAFAAGVIEVEGEEAVKGHSEVSRKANVIARMAEPKDAKKQDRKTISEVLHDIYDSNVQ